MSRAAGLVGQTKFGGRVTSDPRRLRVTHCPVNIAGIPWENVQALRRQGIDARMMIEAPILIPDQELQELGIDLLDLRRETPGASGSYRRPDGIRPDIQG